ncbi:MAG: carbamoyltransferase [Chloroflexi bacterium]|nr:carbamoyltransferase [Chloroflexota bacterium]
MYILGVNNGHDRAAFLLKDEKVLVGIEQERLDRRKHSSSKNLPWEAIHYCLDCAGIEIEELDLVAGSGLWEYDKLPSLLKRFRNSARVSHHLAHAYSVYFSSGFDNAAIFVADGTGVLLSDAIELNGNGARDLFEAESCYHAEGCSIKMIDKRGAPNPKFVLEQSHKGSKEIRNAELSLGNLYSNASSYIFGDWRDSGKVMGLAPFGKKDRFPDVELVQKRNGHLFVRGYDFMNGLKNPCNWKDKECVEEYQDLAFKVQTELEDALIYKLNWLHNKTKAKNLCYSGGVALNCITNQRILEETPFDNVYILPAAGDSGVALGAAYFGYYNVLGKVTRRKLRSAFLGRTYSENEISDAIGWYLNRYYLNNRISVTHHEESSLYCTVAELISKGKIVAWFQGESEIGPRSLGHRSILADPREPEMKDVLNEKVKHREPFRPFAPSILYEFTQEYFDTEYESPFMLLIARVRENKRAIIPAVTHVDGTARLQTVKREDNPKYYSLIREFNKITGVPVILNTSFNVAGEPIVESPTDAINSFVKTNIDYLVLGNIILGKKGNSDMIDRAIPANDGVQTRQPPQ